MAAAGVAGGRTGAAVVARVVAPEVVATVVRPSTKRARDVSIGAVAQPARVRRCVTAVACGAKRARADVTEHAESRGRVVRARRMAEAGSMPTPRPEDGGGILSGGGA